MFDVYAACDTFSQCVNTIFVPGGIERKYGAAQAGLLTTLLGDILPIVLGIGGFITVIVIVIAGIQFITSSGNPEAAAAAKNRLVYAIVGFVVIILAFAVLQIINALFLGTTIV